MKKIIILLLVITLFGCNKKSETQLIVVEGIAKEIILPNNAIIEIEFIEIAKTYSLTTKKLSEKYNILIQSLNKINIEKNRLKTSYYDIKINEEYVKDRYIPNGFIGSHIIELSLDKDYPQLNTILDFINTLNLNLNINLSYNVTDKTIKELKARLLDKCIDDAKNKANIITKRTKTKLIKINKIRYGNTDNYKDIEYGKEIASMKKYANNLAGDFKFEIIPKEIEVNESIVVFWEIE